MKPIFLSCLLMLGFSTFASEFAQVVPGRTFSFPADHQPRNNFQSQWWYITASMQGDDGQSYGAQFTLFSNAMSIAGQTQRIYFAHTAVSSSTDYLHAERYAREDMRHGGVKAQPFTAFIDHWQLLGDGPDPLPGTLSVQEPQFGFELKLSASPYFLQGDQGFSRKNRAGTLASYYYNAPFIEVSGDLRIADKTVRVKGKAWYDREFSSGMFNHSNNSNLLSGDLGWDWLSLHLDDETALMLYRVKAPQETYLDGIVMKKDGSQTPLSAKQIDWQPRRTKVFAKTEYTIEWTLKIPSYQIDITISPINDAQYMNGSIPYWEGMVTTKGSHKANGYLELFTR